MTYRKNERTDIRKALLYRTENGKIIDGYVYNVEGPLMASAAVGWYKWSLSSESKERLKETLKNSKVITREEYEQELFVEKL